MGMKDMPRTNLRLNKVRSVKWIYRGGRYQQLLWGVWTPAPEGAPTVVGVAVWEIPAALGVVA